jgi:hypothetical protein
VSEARGVDQAERLATVQASSAASNAWTRLDFLVAARLREAVDAPEPPASLYKPVQRSRSPALASAALFVLGLGAAAFFTWIYPPPLVRDAMVHEHREATLRGDFQPQKAPLFYALGLKEGASLPGLLQLQRPCEIAGKKAYHVTTFLEKGGGMVTMLAFERPLADAPSGHGKWMGRHWRFVEGVPGKTILLLADNAKVLVMTERLLKSG